MNLIIFRWTRMLASPKQLLIAGVAFFVCASHVHGNESAQDDHGSKRRHGTLSSFVDLRDAELVRQGRDFSCGAAALATLLTYHWLDFVSENDVLRALALILSEQELASRQDSGFSLLDLQRVARALGYRAQGYSLPAEQIVKLAGPVIVFIEPYGYKHFAVLRDFSQGRAVLADPSRGNITLPRHQFLDWWRGENGEGILFVAEPLFLAEVNQQDGMHLRSEKSQSPALVDTWALPPDGAVSAIERILFR